MEKEWISEAHKWVTVYGMKVASSLLILCLGIIAARFLVSLIKGGMQRAKLPDLVISFTCSLASIGLIVCVIVMALYQLGVNMAPIVAVLGAMGLAVGLALQGSLSNLASGVLLAIFRPFDVGDVIENSGVVGVVEEMRIFHTKLRSPDNKEIIIPNSKLTTDLITNFNRKGTRRLDLVFGVSYADDIRKVKRVIHEVLAAESRTLAEPAAQVVLLELADSSVNFAVRPWVKAEDYWDVLFALQEEMKLRFDQEGISIPFPQRDVHLYESKKPGN